MLYYLLYPLKDVISGFNLFRYITFRAAYAAITALLISFIVGPFVIKLLKKKQFDQIIREDGPKSHLKKTGTPTMGGLIILAAILIPSILWADIKNFNIQLMVFVTVWMGILGFIDDYLKIVRKLSEGLVAKYKMMGQITLGIILGVAIIKGPFGSDISVTSTTIPFLKNTTVDLGYLFIPFVIFVITGTSNAVNLTDGLDGLAIGLLGISFTGFAVVSYVSGHFIISNYLNIPYIAQSGELSIYCASVVGASLGFLWFNANPAKVFMGDVGSLALGGALGAVAILVKKEIFLLVIGAVFVAETLSVIIQVLVFKITKRINGKGVRVFKMAPLHHHFELKGWKEITVVIRFWIIGILFAVLSLSMFKIR